MGTTPELSYQLDERHNFTDELYIPGRFSATGSKNPPKYTVH